MRVSMAMSPHAAQNQEPCLAPERGNNDQRKGCFKPRGASRRRQLFEAKQVTSRLHALVGEMVISASADTKTVEQVQHQDVTRLQPQRLRAWIARFGQTQRTHGQHAHGVRGTGRRENDAELGRPFWHHDGLAPRCQR